MRVPVFDDIMIAECVRGKKVIAGRRQMKVNAMKICKCFKCVER